ncbi:inner membrane protein YpjD [Aquimonas sp.]|jgi:ABC-type uncharacterized transport system permease subunit|uniref:cytochrome C assembly family protein n=1 Tax=Aquimonas sp. TaxID=1872588 RepID=UPI0037C05A78
MLSNAIQILALLAYAATALLALRERPQSSEAGASRAVFLCGLLAVDLHAIGYAMRTWHQSGPELHFFAALSLVALGMAVVTLADSILRKVNVLYVLVMPLAALAMLPYALLPPQLPAPLSWQLQTHAWLALLAYAVMSLAAMMALMLWVQERSLRQRRLASQTRGLPPLVQIETLLFRLILVSFVLLGLTLLTGVFFVEDLLAQHLAHKTLLSFLSWSVLGVLLFGRHRFGWRGQRAVRLTLLAMGLLLLAFFGSKLVLQFILSRA